MSKNSRHIPGNNEVQYNDFTVGSCMFYEIAHIKFDIDSYYQVGNY